MCILLATRSHPDYPLILLSNRDEFFERPTQPASFVSDQVLCPKDLGRKEHGTWIGVTRSGRVAVLVNYREKLLDGMLSKVSRGSIVSSFLESEMTASDWAEKVRTTFKDVGGFSLLFGELRENPGNEAIQPLHILSNRYKETASVFTDDSKDTIGMSNSPYRQPWQKVHKGTRLLADVIREACASHWSKDTLISHLLDNVLSVSDPTDSNEWLKYPFEQAYQQMTNSVLIPPVKRQRANNITSTFNYGYYGTRTQTAILVDRQGHVTYVERNLHTSDVLSEQPACHRFEFEIEHWHVPVRPGPASRSLAGSPLS